MVLHPAEMSVRHAEMRVAMVGSSGWNERVELSVISIAVYTVPSTNIGTLDEYEQSSCENKICIVYPFDLSLN